MSVAALLHCACPLVFCFVVRCTRSASRVVMLMLITKHTFSLSTRCPPFIHVLSLYFGGKETLYALRSQLTCGPHCSYFALWLDLSSIVHVSAVSRNHIHISTALSPHLFKSKNMGTASTLQLLIPCFPPCHYCHMPSNLIRPAALLYLVSQYQKDHLCPVSWLCNTF
ncbi:hypothetical protein TRVL_01922 [Trypanosoma vivax]|nr:hypothetical protein TRVL_01922 [Trypanosoma vivax]